MLGKRLRYLREKHNLSQLALAKKLNMPNQNVSNYEREFREPDYDTLQKFADYFNVTTDYLLGRSDEPGLTEGEYREALKEYDELIKILESIPEEKRERYMQRIRDFAQGLSNADK